MTFAEPPRLRLATILRVTILVTAVLMATTTALAADSSLPAPSPSATATTTTAESSAAAKSARGAKSATDAKLAAEAKTMADELAKKFGPGYTTRIDSKRHIVYVAGLDKKSFDWLVTTLGAFHDAAQKFFQQPLPWNITVALLTPEDYRRTVPERARSAGGVYSEESRTLYTLSLSDAVYHEFVHALHHGSQSAHQQRHAAWLVEGLASLFQRMQVKKGLLDPAASRDLATLQAALRDDSALPVEEFCQISYQTFLEKPDLNYAYARHLCFYLHSLDKLEDFYARYVTTCSADPTGRQALAATLAKPLDQVDADWRTWVLAQQAPTARSRAEKAYLGLQMKGVPEGVRVTGFVKGSPAARAGQLKIGDIITSAAGRPCLTVADLTAAVQSCKPGQTIDIQVLRNGEKLTLKQLLGET